MYRMINSHRANIRDGQEPSDLLTLFIKAADEEKLDDKWLKDVILNFIIAAIFQSTFSETLRLYPSVPKISRPNGVPVYANEFVVWVSWAMGRDKKIWGEDAQVFESQRFLDNEDLLKPQNQYNLGQQFATIEVIILMTMMLKEFKFELVPGQKSPPEFQTSLTLSMKKPTVVRSSLPPCSGLAKRVSIVPVPWICLCNLHNYADAPIQDGDTKWDLNSRPVAWGVTTRQLLYVATPITLVLFPGIENYNLLENALAPLILDLQFLDEHGFYDNQERYWNVELYFSSDWKFLAICLEMNAANANYFCPWC
ncbi:cytochrome P450 [Gigaspora rosea]|uniref:Cytochrome P450 n=1 Tax=Gigaspora rosea TaxID=44941 RepID=A0A397UVI8_9GLOM|nr:cytochrome P450 [Gigaspora rosea]